VTDVPDNLEAATLRSEQLVDDTLLGCFALAKRNKGLFYFKNGVLHRADSVAGQMVEQLVLPEGRRQRAIDLAHETFGAHELQINSKTTSLQFLVAYFGS